MAQTQILKADECTGDFILNTQTEVDAFNCISVTGNLTISIEPDAGDAITNLDALASLVSVSGNFQIAKTGLTNLDGLSGLTSVGGQFIIYLAGL